MRVSKIHSLIALLFFLFFMTIFLSRDNYIGEIMIKLDVKSNLKKESYYKKSLFFRDKELKKRVLNLKKELKLEDITPKMRANLEKEYQELEKKVKLNKEFSGKFKRVNISALYSVKRYRAELMKFASVKKEFENIKSKFILSNYIFYGLAIVALLFGVLLFFIRDFRLAILMNTILTTGLYFYNREVVIKLREFKLLPTGKLYDETFFYGISERKNGFEIWGLSEVTQHLIVVSIFILIIFGIIKNRLESKKYFTKLNIKDDFYTIKKEMKLLKDKIWESRFAYEMLLPASIIVVLIVIYPLLFNFTLSFSNLNQKRVFELIHGGKLYYVGIGHYLDIILDKQFWSVLLRTLIWTVVNVSFHVVGGVSLAILLNRKMKIRYIYQIMLILPWAIPQFIAVLVWKGMYNTSFGAINLIIKSFLNVIPSEFWFKFNMAIPTGEIPWLSDPFWLFTGALITNIWLGIPFMMMIALGGLQSIPETYYEAADIDGASDWEKIKHITLPLLKPVMIPAVIMGTVWTFNNVNVIYLLSENSLTGKVDILVTFVYKAAFMFYRYGYAAAFSTVIFLILLGMSFIMIKQSKKEDN